MRIVDGALKSHFFEFFHVREACGVIGVDVDEVLETEAFGLENRTVSRQLVLVDPVRGGHGDVHEYQRPQGGRHQ